MEVRGKLTQYTKSEDGREKDEVDDKSSVIELVG